MKMVVRQGICEVGGLASINIEVQLDEQLTISDSLARAERSVGGASRWRSMASKTRTNRKSWGRCRCGGGCNILASSTVN